MGKWFDKLCLVDKISSPMNQVASIKLSVDLVIEILQSTFEASQRNFNDATNLSKISGWAFCNKTRINIKYAK